MAVDEECRFGWCDAKSGHVCRQVGEHEGHTCRYCGTKYDPELRLIADPQGGIIAIREATPAATKTARAGNRATP